MAGEYGYFLMDAVALCFVIAALIGALGIYRTTVHMRYSALMKTAAIHIAEIQCSHLEEAAYSGKLPEGDIPWLGRPEDLTQDGRSLTVQTTVTTPEPSMRQISIKVTWTLRGKEDSIRLERQLREHG